MLRLLFLRYAWVRKSTKMRTGAPVSLGDGGYLYANLTGEGVYFVPFGGQ